MLQGVFPISMKDLKEILNLKVYCEANSERTADCGYAGDLLSWVMGHAPAGCAWFTVMTNVNVIAVAHLADAACVIVTEGAAPDAEMLRQASEQGINVYGTVLNTFEAVAAVAVRRA